MDIRDAARRLDARRDVVTLKASLAERVADRDAATRDGRLEDAAVARLWIDRLLGELSAALVRYRAETVDSPPQRVSR